MYFASFAFLPPKALPDGDSGQKAVIDAHQCRSFSEPAASSYLRHHPFFKKAVPTLPTPVSRHAAASAALAA